MLHTANICTCTRVVNLRLQGVHVALCKHRKHLHMHTSGGKGFMLHIAHCKQWKQRLHTGCGSACCKGFMEVAAQCKHCKHCKHCKQCKHCKHCKHCKQWLHMGSGWACCKGFTEVAAERWRRPIKERNSKQCQYNASEGPLKEGTFRVVPSEKHFDESALCGRSKKKWIFRADEKCKHLQGGWKQNNPPMAFHRAHSGVIFV